MKTKIDVEKGKHLAKKYGFNSCEGIQSIRRSKGLLLFWDDTLYVDIKSINKNVVSAYVSDRQHYKFWLTYIYGHHEHHIRQ